MHVYDTVLTSNANLQQNSDNKCKYNREISARLTGATYLDLLVWICQVLFVLLSFFSSFVLLA